MLPQDPPVHSRELAILEREIAAVENLRSWQPVPPDAAAHLLRFTLGESTQWPGFGYQDDDGLVKRIAGNSAIASRRAFRLVIGSGLVVRPDYVQWLCPAALEQFVRLRGFDFATMLALLEECEIETFPVVMSAITAGVSGMWPSETLTDYVLADEARVDAILRYLEPSTNAVAATNVLAFFERLERLGAAASERFFSIALGERKLHRVEAQRILARDPNREIRALGAVTDKSAVVRAAAASWIGAIGDARLAEAILVQARKEKNDAALAAQLGALSALGVPLDEFVGRERLTNEARQGMAKSDFGALAFFEPAVATGLLWSDNREPVDEEIVRWLIVQAVKLNSPSPSELLRRRLPLFDEESRHRFGLAILTAWVEKDVEPLSRAEIEDRAWKDARSRHRYFSAPGMPASMRSRTERDFFDDIFPQWLESLSGSAIPWKGALAIAGPCCDGTTLPMIESYVRTNYGMRAGQSRALLRVASWIDDPAAIAFVLSVAARFRTRTIQEEAALAAAEIAERRGWNVEELSDRSVPSAGFDDLGTLELSYGHRTLTARLTPFLDIAIYDEHGEKLTALPAPSGDDDQAAARAAKTALAGAKKALKALVSEQTARLREAMCFERSWPFDDWQRYFLDHPIVGRLATRLVWQSYQGSHRIEFLPQSRQDFRDVTGAPMAIDPACHVRLAHRLLVPATRADAWRDALAARGVDAPFSQFETFAPAAGDLEDSPDEYAGLRGHMTTAFTLRTRALSFGFVRGAPGDGAFFTTYRRVYQSANLAVLLHFSGNELPEKDVPVALESLTFVRANSGVSWNARPLLLADVPRILRAECIADFRAIAKETRFDPAWRDKVFDPTR